jgi:hypothetical protein
VELHRELGLESMLQRLRDVARPPLVMGDPGRNHDPRLPLAESVHAGALLQLVLDAVELPDQIAGGRTGLGLALPAQSRDPDGVKTGQG